MKTVKLILMLWIMLLSSCKYMVGPYDYQELPGNADLVGLSMTNNADLAANFKSSQTLYDLSVNASTSATRITPVLSDPLATVSVNGLSAANNVPSELIGLSEGVLNYISITVTAQDKKTAKIYLLKISRGVILNLNEARINSINITPAGVNNPNSFNSDVYTYNNITCAYSVTSINFNPVLKNNNASFIVKNNGNLSGQNISLNLGNNQITIEVTAVDGVTKKTYTFHVRRLNNIASLNDLSVYNGAIQYALTPAFSSAAYNYSNLTVDIRPASLRIYLTVTDNNSGCTINGETFNKTQGYLDLTINTDNVQINVAVTSEDGTVTHTYVVSVAFIAI